MRLIGLTGGIASGKSAVDRLLAARGAEVIDADQLARRVAEPGEAAFAEIVERFGPGVVLPDGTLDRGRVGAIVFADPAARRDLERITHPRIAELLARQVLEALAGPAPLVVVDVPLLFEGERQGQFEGIMLVYAPVTVQLSRLVERDGLSEEAARQRIAAQLPIDEKRERANWVIDNSGTLDATSDQVDQWWQNAVLGGRSG